MSKNNHSPPSNMRIDITSFHPVGSFINKHWIYEVQSILEPNDTPSKVFRRYNEFQWLYLHAKAVPATILPKFPPKDALDSSSLELLNYRRICFEHLLNTLKRVDSKYIQNLLRKFLTLPKEEFLYFCSIRPVPKLNLPVSASNLVSRVFSVVPAFEPSTIIKFAELMVQELIDRNGGVSVLTLSSGKVVSLTELDKELGDVEAEEISSATNESKVESASSFLWENIKECVDVVVSKLEDSEVGQETNTEEGKENKKEMFRAVVENYQSTLAVKSTLSVCQNINGDRSAGNVEVKSKGTSRTTKSSTKRNSDPLLNYRDRARAICDFYSNKEYLSQVNSFLTRCGLPSLPSQEKSQAPSFLADSSTSKSFSFFDLLRFKVLHKTVELSVILTQSLLSEELLSIYMAIQDLFHSYTNEIAALNGARDQLIQYSKQIIETDILEKDYRALSYRTKSMNVKSDCEKIISKFRKTKKALKCLRAVFVILFNDKEKEYERLAKERVAEGLEKEVGKLEKVMRLKIDLKSIVLGHKVEKELKKMEI